MHKFGRKRKNHSTPSLTIIAVASQERQSSCGAEGLTD